MKFKEILNSKKFVITGELAPPKGISKEEFLQNVEVIKNYVDAINITDNQRAINRASSLVYSGFVLEKGAIPIWQITARDRNSLALISDILGAGALGIENILAVSGDFPDKNSPYFPETVYELDSVGLIELIKKIEGGRDLNNKEIKNPPKFTVGAVTNPSALPRELQIIKLWKKILAGAEFIQTQPIYNPSEFKNFLEEFYKMKEIFEKTVNCAILKFPKILAGILPLTSLKLGQFLNKNLSGVKIPEKILEKIENSKDPQETGLEITLKIIDELKQSVAGIHIMALGSAETIKRVASSISGN